MKEVIESLDEHGGEATAALLSGFWEIIDRPIKRVVLDECHTFKRTDGAFYSAHLL